ncbi:hypothetical protein Tco_0385504 [Tanacetum coccineum]
MSHFQGSVEEASKQEDAAAKEVREDGERPLLLVVQELTSEVARYKEKWSAVVVFCSRYKEKCLLIDPRQKYGQILRSRKQLPVTYKNDYVRQKMKAVYDDSWLINQSSDANVLQNLKRCDLKVVSVQFESLQWFW